MLRVDPKIVAVAKDLQDTYGNPADGRLYATGDWAEYAAGGPRPDAAAAWNESQPDGSIDTVVVARDLAVFDRVVAAFRGLAADKTFTREAPGVACIGAIRLIHYTCILKALDTFDVLCSLPNGTVYRVEEPETVTLTVRVKQADGKVTEKWHDFEAWDEPKVITKFIREKPENKGCTRVELIDAEGGGACFFEQFAPEPVAPQAFAPNLKAVEAPAPVTPPLYRMLTVRRSWDSKSGITLEKFRKGCPRLRLYTDAVGEELSELARVVGRSLPVDTGAWSDGTFVVEDEQYRVRHVAPDPTASDVIPPNLYCVRYTNDGGGKFNREAHKYTGRAFFTGDSSGWTRNDAKVAITGVPCPVWSKGERVVVERVAYDVFEQSLLLDVPAVPLPPETPPVEQEVDYVFEAYYISDYRPVPFKVKLLPSAVKSKYLSDDIMERVRQAAIKALDGAGRTRSFTKMPENPELVGYIQDTKDKVGDRVYGWYFTRKPEDNGKVPYIAKARGFDYSVVFYASGADEARRLAQASVPAYNWDVIQYQNTVTGVVTSVFAGKSPKDTDRVKFTAKNEHGGTASVSLSPTTGSADVIKALRAQFSPGRDVGLSVKASGPNAACFTGEFVKVGN